MIRGTINGRLEAVVPIRLRGWKSELSLDAIVDTGYTGLLALPDSIIAALDLTFSFESQLMLADGSERTIDVYRAEILWHGTWRTLLVSSIGAGVVMGMKLLEGSYLQVAVGVGGEVIITPFE